MTCITWPGRAVCAQATGARDSEQSQQFRTQALDLLQKLTELGYGGLQTYYYPDGVGQIVKDADFAILHDDARFAAIVLALKTVGEFWVADREVTRGQFEQFNSHIEQAATEFNWNYIGGLMKAFERHGYPAVEDDRWIVQWEESVRQQGPGTTASSTMGTYHPNEEGHQAISRAIVNAVVPDLAHRPEILAPKIVGSTSFVFQQNSGLGYQSLEVAFDTPINPATFTPADVRIATTSGLTAKVRAVNAFPDNQRFQIVFEPAAVASRVPGEYLLTIGPDVRSPFGIPMDQNGDGRLAQRIGSHELDQYSKTFNIVSPVRLVDGTVIIKGFDQADVVRVTLAAGNNVQVSMAPPSKTIVNPLADIHPDDAWNAVLASNWGVTFAAADVRRIVFLGGAGNDTFINDTAIDVLAVGGEGDDILTGGEGSDVLYGNDGADTLNGRGGRDELFGGLGNDQIFGGYGADWLYGEEGDDNLEGGSGDDTLRGGFGNDRLYGNDGIDILFGDAGDDILDGGLGTNDRLVGGSGRDTFIDWYYPLPKSKLNNRPDSQRVREDILSDYVFGEDTLRLFYR